MMPTCLLAASSIKELWVYFLQPMYAQLVKMLSLWKNHSGYRGSTREQELPHTLSLLLSFKHSTLNNSNHPRHSVLPHLFHTRETNISLHVHCTLGFITAQLNYHTEKKALWSSCCTLVIVVWGEGVHTITSPP